MPALHLILQLVQTVMTRPWNPLRFLGLFFSVTFSGACAVLIGAKLTPQLQSVLGFFVVVFPLGVLALLGLLTSRYHVKLYAPQDFRMEEHFVVLAGAESQSSREGGIDSEYVISRGRPLGGSTVRGTDFYMKRKSWSERPRRPDRKPDHHELEEDVVEASAWEGTTVSGEAATDMEGDLSPVRAATGSARGERVSGTRP